MSAEERLRGALDASGDAIVITDADGRIVEVSAAALRFNPYTREQVLGRSLVELAVEGGATEEEQAAIRAAAAGSYEAVRRTAAGRTVSTTVTITPLAGGGAVFASQGLEAYRERRSRAMRLRLLAEAARTLNVPQDLDSALAAMADLIVPEWADGLLIALADPEGNLTVAAMRTSDPTVEALALANVPSNLGEVIGGGILASVAGERRTILVADVAELPEPSREKMAPFGVGSLVGVPLVAKEELIGILIVSTNLDRPPFDSADADTFEALGGRAALGIRAARLHEAMRAAEGRFRAAFEHAPIGIAISRPDPDGVFRYEEVNPALCLIAGRPRAELLRRPAPEFTHPDDREAERQRLEWLIAGRVEEVSGEKRLVRPDGDARWVQVRSAPLGDGTFVQQILDVTDNRRFQRELEHLASHDTLTGLLNRRRFEDALDQALANVRRHGDQAAVLTLDIDNFKHVNDTYGHPTGDEVLRAVAHALQGRLRVTDRVARLGGDEFGVILTRTDSDNARAVANELLQAVREAALTVGERRVRVTASAGLRLLDATEQSSPGDLLSEADMAMYDAKERGRDRLSVLRPGDRGPERVRARMRWSERVREALEGGESRFVLYEQPIMRLSDGALDRAELLIRLIDENGDVNAPARFLGVAARYGQIQAIDRWVVGQALELLRHRDITFEVNLSGESISDPAVVDFILAAVAGSSVDPSRLVFEVTETSAIGNLEQARGLAERLTELGCGFALDDFGAGFGSFAYLKHLPLNIIKIDGEFIRGLRTSNADQVTVRAIVGVARGLGKETVAEFVEDSETLELLRKLGVDHAQGYHIGRPVPVDQSA